MAKYIWKSFLSRFLNHQRKLNDLIWTLEMLSKLKFNIMRELVYYEISNNEVQRVPATYKIIKKLSPETLFNIPFVKRLFHTEQKSKETGKWPNLN